MGADKIISLSLQTFCRIYSNEPDRHFFKQDFELATELNLVLSHPILQLAFENGGYVAGGFLRHALARRLPIINRTYTNAQKKLFILSGSDIDIFFRDTSGFTSFYEKARECLVTKSSPVGDELTGCEIPKTVEINASNLDIKFKWFLNGEIQDAVKKRIQAIHSYVGEPEDVLKTFDFNNCMIATDGKTVWFNPNVVELEDNKLLSLNENQNLNKILALRVQKYVIEHEYTNFDPINDSLYIFADWCQKKLQPNGVATGTEMMTLLTEKAGLANLLKTDFIKTEDLMLFFGLIEMPLFQKTEPFLGVYEEEEDYAIKGHADAVGSTIAYRIMTATKGYKPPFTRNEYLNDYIGY